MGPARGHRLVPHTADVRIEAWAPDRAGCLTEAVAAMVESFADLAGARLHAEREFRPPPAADEDLLVAVLDEVIYRMETADELPLVTEITDDAGGLRVRWGVTGTGEVELTGAVPKAVSLHELRFGGDDRGWCGAVTLDV